MELAAEDAEEEVDAAAEGKEEIKRAKGVWRALSTRDRTGVESEDLLGAGRSVEPSIEAIST